MVEYFVISFDVNQSMRIRAAQFIICEPSTFIRNEKNTIYTSLLANFLRTVFPKEDLYLGVRNRP